MQRHHWMMIAAVSIELSGCSPKMTAQHPSAAFPDTWTQVDPAAIPPRRHAAVAYDGARDRIVLFGGIGAAGLNGLQADTWEWDGSTWLLRQPTSSPSARSLHAMAYDARRGRVVLFGGSTRDEDSGEPLGDTWEWDGTNWLQRQPMTAPPARFGHAMAYDAARERVVLLGGGGPLGSGGTWEWDGSDWLERHPMSSPSFRTGHAMAYDAARARVVLVGGAEVWEWNGTNWLKGQPTSSPPARAWPGMAYDAGRQRIVLFAGLGQFGYLDDTWEWDGATWVERQPMMSPPRRSDHAMAFDAARGRIVLFSGRRTTAELWGDTWTWDGSVWVERPALSSPPAGQVHVMAYDAARRRVVLLGWSDLRSHTWEWDGAHWLERRPITPPPNQWLGMAYDAARGRVILFVGAGALTKTLEWDGSDWLELPSASSPLPRGQTAMAYDTARRRMVLFGGLGGGDTWEWDGSAWLEHRPASSPHERFGYSMAYDAARRRVVLFGGAYVEPTTDQSTIFADTWEWDGSNWFERHPASSPSNRRWHAMAYDARRERVVMVGGFGSTGPTVNAADTWEWDGSNWLQRQPMSSPPSRHGHAMAYDTARGRLVLFGGLGHFGGVDLADTWER